MLNREVYETSLLIIQFDLSTLNKFAITKVYFTPLHKTEKITTMLMGTNIY